VIKIGTLYIDIKEIAAVDTAGRRVFFRGGGNAVLLAYEIHHILKAIQERDSVEQYD